MFGRKKKVCVVTACGKTKRDVPLPARKLYKSARITAVHNRKSDCDMVHPQRQARADSL